MERPSAAIDIKLTLAALCEHLDHWCKFFLTSRQLHDWYLKYMTWFEKEFLSSQFFAFFFFFSSIEFTEKSAFGIKKKSFFFLFLLHLQNILHKFSFSLSFYTFRTTAKNHKEKIYQKFIELGFLLFSFFCCFRLGKFRCSFNTIQKPTV